MYHETDKKLSDESVKSGHELNADGAVERHIDNDPVYSYKEQRAIIHRVDRRLVVTCGLIYCFSLIDRGNLGNASIAGMTDDLNLGIEFRYSIIVLVFFPTYVIFQPPATVASRKFGPRIFLSTICLLWGATEIAFGFVKKWTDMLGLRVLLGILEAGLYPSVVYLLATWYSRFDFPEKADRSWKFLSTEERDFILRRINKDRDDAIPEPFTIKRFLKPALDIKIWILALISL
ncbi:MAG: hypothetical protein Q9197_005117 [Variospora fuerteventurae]